MGRRTVRGASKRGPKNNIWTVVLGDQISLSPQALNSARVIQDTDWVRQSGGEKATLLRVRGWWFLSAPTSDIVTVRGAVHAYMAFVDEDVGTDALPNSADAYVAEDILWTGGMALPVHPVGSAPFFSGRMDIDVKAMRRFRAGQQLRFVVMNSSITTPILEMSFLLRGLIRLGGN